MGRTNQVLTGGSIFSTSPQTTTMKIVLALVVLCLFQFSLAEQKDVDNAETNLVLERDVREQEEREKRRQKEVWKRKKTETEERKENWKEAESKKEGKESKKAKVHEKTGWSNISI